jgi:hypothetical protein
MFPEPDPPPVELYSDVSSGYGPIRYTKYKQPKTRKEKCDDCLAHLVATNGNAPATNPAAFRRTQAGANTLLLCHTHKQARKEAEAL